MNIETGTHQPQPSGDTSIQQILLLSSIENQLKQNIVNQQLILNKLTNINELLEDTYSDEIDISVAGLNISFGNMVTFMIMWSFASIPAAIIIGVIYLIALVLLGQVIY